MWYLKPLQTSVTDFRSDEDIGDVSSQTSFLSGELINRPTSVWVDDAVIHLLDHLEKTGSSVRIIFFDFSSAFKILPSPLRTKLESTVTLSSWILDYLTNRPVRPV